MQEAAFEANDELTADQVKQARSQIREAFERMREIDRRMDARKKQFEEDRKATLEMLDQLEARLGVNAA